MKDPRLSVAQDAAENMLVAFEYMGDFLEILGLGFLNDHCSGKEREAACVYVLGEYMEKVKEEQLVKLMEILKELNR